MEPVVAALANAIPKTSAALLAQYPSAPSQIEIRNLQGPPGDPEQAIPVIESEGTGAETRQKVPSGIHGVGQPASGGEQLRHSNLQWKEADAHSTASRVGGQEETQQEPQVPPSDGPLAKARPSNRDDNEVSEATAALLVRNAAPRLSAGADRAVTDSLVFSHSAEAVMERPAQPSSSPGPASRSPEPMADLTTWEQYRVQVSQMVNTAWLRNKLDQAEMHVELRSGSLGAVAVHAVVREASVGAEIRVDNHQTQAMLASELPALERALSDRHLRLESIAIHHETPAGGTGDAGSSDSFSPPFTHPQASRFAWTTEPDSEPAPSLIPEVGELEYPQARLSVHA